MFGKISLDGKSSNTLFKKVTTQVQPFKKKEGNQKNEKTERSEHKSKMIRKEEKSQFKDDKNKKKVDSFAKSQEELQGAKFRILNELLYTRPSQQAVEYFHNNKQDFQLYHEGYRHQTTKWHHRPVDQIIEYLQKQQKTHRNKTIADLGCGQGFIQDILTPKGFKNILSYDLVAVKPFIIEADIANIPLKEESVDICIFCLSLMGTNYLSFICQAWRILKDKGQLIISQVESRSPSWDAFINLIQSQGFHLVNNGIQLISKYHKNQEGQQGSRYFRTMLFSKTEKPKQAKIQHEGRYWKPEDLSTQVLLSCKYKKR